MKIRKPSAPTLLLLPPAIVVLAAVVVVPCWRSLLFQLSRRSG